MRRAAVVGHAAWVLVGAWWCLGASTEPDAALVTEARGYLVRMAQVDSPPGGEILLLEEANRYARSQGLYAQVHPSAPGRGNLVVRLPANPPQQGGVPLVLVAPVDVPPGNALGEKAGALEGGGVTTGKAFAAAALAGMLQLHRAAGPRAREVDLVLTSDGTGDASQGMRHLYNVLPTLGQGGAVVFPGGAVTAGHVLVHAGQKRAQPVRLVAQVSGTQLGVMQPPGALAVLGPALGRVEGHTFPLPWEGSTVAWGGALGLTAQTAPERARTEPAVQALLASTCQVARVEVDRVVDGIPHKATAQLECFLSPGEAVQHFGWRVVDAVKDTRVTVDRVMAPVPPEPHALEAPWKGVLEAAFPGQPMLAVSLPSRAHHVALLEHGRAFGIPLGMGDGQRLTAEQFGRDVAAMTALLRAATAVTP